MEPAGSLTRSQDPAIDPYREPVEFSLHPLFPFLYYLRILIFAHPCLGLPNDTLYEFIFLPMSRPSHPP
jgi:hypothetical protein